MDGRGRKSLTLKTSRSAHRRSDSARRFADFKRFFLRNRFAVRASVILGIVGIVTLVQALGVPAALLHLAEGVKSWGGKSVGLTLKTITIAGLDNLKAAEVKKAIANPTHAGLYDIDLGAARERLLRVPWIADATILRIPPDRLHVTIKERVPAFVWQHDKIFYAVDAHGAVIARVDGTEFASLAHVVGAGAAEAAPALADALAQSPIVATRVQSSVFVGARRWDLHFDNHLVIELPDRGVPEALEVLSRMITDEDLLDHNVLVVDLRDPSAPRLRLSKETVKGKTLPGQDT